MRTHFIYMIISWGKHNGNHPHFTDEKSEAMSTLHQVKTFPLDSFLATCTKYVAPWDLCLAFILWVQTQRNLSCREKNEVAQQWPNQETDWECPLTSQELFWSCFSSFFRSSCTACIGVLSDTFQKFFFFLKSIINILRGPVLRG